MIDNLVMFYGDFDAVFLNAFLKSIIWNMHVYKTAGAQHGEMQRAWALEDRGLGFIPGSAISWLNGRWPAASSLRLASGSALDHSFLLSKLGLFFMKAELPHQKWRRGSQNPASLAPGFLPQHFELHWLR